MLARMTGRELTEWQAYERVSGPLGVDRLDALAALQSFYALRAAGAKKVSIKDLMPVWDRPEPMDWRAMKMQAIAINRMYGGEVNDPSSDR